MTFSCGLTSEICADGGLNAGQFGGVAGDWVAGIVVD